MKRVGVAVVMAAVLAVLPSTASAGGHHQKKQKDTNVQLLAINDFHGNLQPPSGSSGVIPTGVGTTVPAGGAEYLATWMDRLRANNHNTVEVGAGDLIGASPLISGLFHDEPTIEAMNAMGLQVSSVGNHEFDEGLDELLRMQNGGCHPVDGCQDGDPFTGAFFQYLAANVFFENTDRTILPPYEIERVGKARIAFIGLTLEGTPLIVTPAGVEGLEFRDEIVTINALVERLRRQRHIHSFVVLIHEGGQQNAPFSKGFMDSNACENFTGAIQPIVEALDDDVDVVVSAHTHQPYICNFNGIVTTSAASFGRLITSIDLRIGRKSRDVDGVTAHNNIVTRDVPADPEQTQLIAKYNALSAPIANRVVGSVTADIPRAANRAGESALGDVIADSQLLATTPPALGGAVAAFMNPGGIRADLVFAASGTEGDGNVTYEEIFTVQPFGNSLVTMTLTGAQIETLLEQQFCGTNAGARRVLQPSVGFTYTWNFAAIGAADCTTADAVDPATIAIGGVPVDPAASYRVTVNSFLATGGDGFAVLNDGTDRLGGAVDLDAVEDYFAANPGGVGPGPQDRITRIG
jgi:5'-nucleotidase